MQNFKKIICLLMAVALMASFAFTAFATETDKPEVNTQNNIGVLDMTHLDVKSVAKYYAEIDGETVVLDATLVPESIVVTVDAPGANLVYNFANYNYFTINEAGMDEYRIILDGTDGAMLNYIQWDGISFYMKNVYVSARLVFAEVPEVLAAEMNKTADGAYYVDVTNMAYTGMQECTGHNGLRSEGNHGLLTGVDLYLSYVPGMSVETPVPETTVPETTVPETTVPETTVPETTVPETTVPETTIPEPPVDEEPETGDTGMGMLMVLMTVSVIGMAATAIIGKKLKYVGKF